MDPSTSSSSGRSSMPVNIGQLFARNWAIKLAAIAPRDLDVLLDSVGKKDVRIVPLVRVEAESGYVLRGLSIVPSVARVVGPEKSLAAVESITTLPTVISSVNGPFFRTVPLDT